MQINTKYSLNDIVISIDHKHEQEYISCKACSGKGKIKLDDGTLTSCPKCYGRLGEYRYLPKKWIIDNRLTIGQVSAKVTNIEPDGIFGNVGHYGGEELTKIEIGYMCYETGIGTGIVWKEELLYGTEKEAQKECDRLNVGA